MDLAATLTLAALAVAIEACVGYPQGLFRAIGHPVTWIGRLIALADSWLNHDGSILCHAARPGFSRAPLAFSDCRRRRHSFQPRARRHRNFRKLPAFALTALIASSLIAQRSLDAHVLAVAEALSARARWRAAARRWRKSSAAMWQTLDEAGVARAAIESLAENFSDGVVAPAFWLALGGLALAAPATKPSTPPTA